MQLLHTMSPYLLLGFFIAGVLHAWVPTRYYSRYLSGSDWRSVLSAAAFGVPLPLCSCGVLPTAVSLRSNGASRAATTSFLIATPQTGVDSIAATYSMMGLPFAILRPVAALVTAVFGGLAVGQHERHLPAEAATPSAESEDEARPTTWQGKLVETLRYGFFEMMQTMGRWLILGLIVAALITVLVPDDFFQTYARYPLLNMLLIVAIAIPMYLCATGSIPIAAALMLKGLTPGCALVLLMAGPAASFASILIVSRMLGKRSALIYLASITLGAIGFGLVVDYWPWLQHTVSSAMPHCHGMMHHHGATSWLNWLCSIALLAMIVVAVVAKYRKSLILKRNKTNTMKTYKVKGMMCVHCQANVEKGVASLPGVQQVKVDLAQGLVYVEGDVAPQTVTDKITELGYQVVES